MNRTLLAAVVVLFAVPALAQDATRPEGNSVGIGAGWSFPQSILEPNTVSVRFRLGGLALEPTVLVGGAATKSLTSSSTTLPGQPASTDNDDDRAGGLSLGVSTAVRYPIASRGPVDFVAIGSLGVAYGSQTQDNNVQDTDQLNRTTSTAFGVGLGWGLGLEWFVKQNLSLSADATNPLVSWHNQTQRTELEQTVAGEKYTSVQRSGSSGFDWALRFTPTVRLLVHLYF